MKKSDQKKAPEAINRQRLKRECLESESGGDRTLDPRLKRPLLYHLSYRLSVSKQIPNIRLSSVEFQPKIRKNFVCRTAARTGTVGNFNCV